MKRWGLIFCVLFISAATIADLPPGPLTILRTNGSSQVSLPREPIAPVGGTRYLLQIESSHDLNSWSPAGEMSVSGEGTPVYQPAQTSGHEFFRLRPVLMDSDEDTDGAALAGFGRIFKEELRHAGYPAPEDFALRHIPSTNFLSGISFDPRTANYWDKFNADPAVVNQGLTTNSPDWRSYDFRLNPQELSVFLTNGFVVNERLGTNRFAQAFYQIFNDDLPVFVSADSVLHAWHFSFEHMLSEVEETALAQTLCGYSGQPGILDMMANTLAAIPDPVRQGVLRESLADADYFLAVGRSLAMGSPVSTVLGPDPNVGLALTAIRNRDQYLSLPGFPIFGTNRLADFTQFEVRGYYDRSLQLSNYFNAFMWTARIDLRMLESKPSTQSLRELGTAVVLSKLLEASGAAQRWHQMDAVLRLFIGRPDEMTFAHLKPLLDTAGITSLESITSTNQLAALQAAIVQGGLGLQLIPGDAYMTPFSPQQVQLPRSFALTGQRFVPDGWTLAEVTFDRILWPEDVPGMTIFRKVLRRVPSALDAAYGVLGNREIGWEIGLRMLAPRTPGNFRDGFPYAHNLEAMAATFDRIDVAAWQDSIYTRWLYALRALSEPTTGTEYPEAMRTRSWVMRTLNTQLASYTELKHDTVLYAKQPYASSFLCDYPAGFIEPVTGFWRRMRELAQATADGLSKLPMGGSIQIRSSDPWVNWGQPIDVDLGLRHAARINFCTNFAAVMTRLEEMSGKELRQEPFTQSETAFIKGLMNSQDHWYVGPTYDGWYPSLYYKDYALAIGSADENGSNKIDPLVTDVFTAPPDAIDGGGGVLHEATGPVDFLLIAVNNGPDRMVYAGPVMSHYEFLLPGPTLQRLTDSEWSTRSPKPARPDWTRSYLVPRSP